jgi:ABC-2 type transport system permease protein
MFGTLLAKDLRRAWRNPVPWLLNLALPLGITAIIGMVFGGQSDNSQIGRIKFAVVDEDHSLFSQIFRGGSEQGQAAQMLEPVYLERGPALRQLNDSKLSAVLVIPPRFTSNYLTGGKVTLELVKNPAEQIHPAILEELLGVAVSGLNALSRNFAGEFPAWRRVADGRADYHEVSRLVEEEGNKVQALRHYLFPPLVSYTNVTTVQAAAGGATEKAGPKFNLFGFMLPGMAAMFLLLLATQAVSDLHRELALRTFERFNTLREQLLGFVASKALFCLVTTSVGAAILLGGGALLFDFTWPRPLEVGLMTVAYVCFATGLTSVIVALMPDERRANAMGNIVSMILAMMGGAMFPVEQLPAVLREHLLPLMPTSWYISTVRDLWWAQVAWPVAAVKLLALGALGLAAATFLFQRRFSQGTR